MAKQVHIILAGTLLLFLLCADQSFGSFFSSLQFTRDSLMDFSRGSQRTVDILTPKKTTKKVMKTVVVKPEKKKTSLAVKTMSVPETKGSWGSRDKLHHRHRPVVKSRPIPRTTQIPATETVVTYQRKRKVYRQRSSPSNKFLEVLNDIERAVANANASGIRYSDRALAKQKALVEKAVRFKSYKYARQVSHMTFFTALGLTSNCATTWAMGSVPKKILEVPKIVNIQKIFNHKPIALPNVSVYASVEQPGNKCLGIYQSMDKHLSL